MAKGTGWIVGKSHRRSLGGPNSLRFKRRSAIEVQIGNIKSRG